MNVEKMIETMNEAIKFHIDCLDKGYNELLEGHQSEMRGMIRMLNIATGKTYKITKDGIKEA